jgi:hypothetical protein
MNASQKKAIAALEKAFEESSRHGLVFAGIDGDLMCARLSDVAKLLYASSTCESFVKLSNEDGGSVVIVDAGGAYLDSGAT